MSWDVLGGRCVRRIWALLFIVSLYKIRQGCSHPIIKFLVTLFVARRTVKQTKSTRRIGVIRGGEREIISYLAFGTESACLSLSCRRSGCSPLLVLANRQPHDTNTRPLHSPKLPCRAPPHLPLLPHSPHYRCNTPSTSPAAWRTASHSGTRTDTRWVVQRHLEQRTMAVNVR